MGADTCPKQETKKTEKNNGEVFMQSTRIWMKSVQKTFGLDEIDQPLCLQVSRSIICFCEEARQ